MSRPVIGIIAGSALLHDTYPVFIAGQMNVEAVAQASGCAAMLFPACEGGPSVEELLQICDGFVFTGGRANVHPAHYGHDETPAHGDFDHARDALALPLIRAAVAAGAPVIGLCRGFQEMAVAFGSTLHPEIRSIPGVWNHRMPPDGALEEKFALRHDVTLTPGGVFAKIFGSEVVRTNTLHGQGIQDPGPRVVIEGRTEDGVAEAIRIADAPGFALGVQWHPEYEAAEDPVSLPLFQAFGDAARAWRVNRRAGVRAA